MVNDLSTLFGIPVSMMTRSMGWPSAKGTGGWEHMLCVVEVGHISLHWLEMRIPVLRGSDNSPDVSILNFFPADSIMNRYPSSQELGTGRQGWNCSTIFHRVSRFSV